MTDRDFLTSIKLLFAERRIYRIAAIVAVLVFLIDTTGVLMIAGLVAFFIIVPKLVRAETTLEDKIWDRFGRRLQNAKMGDRSWLPESDLKGVIGSLGDTQRQLVIAEGVSGGYPVRLLKQWVTYKLNSKNGTYPRTYRVLEITTKQNFYHVFLDAKSNHESIFPTSMNVLSRSIKGNKRIQVEGDVNKHFRIYVPRDDRFKSLVTLSPEKLWALRQYGRRFDVEFVDNKIYLITSTSIKRRDVLLYQESIFNVLNSIGVDIVRTRRDIDNTLVVKTPTIVTLF